MLKSPEAIVKNRDRIAALAQAYEGQMVSFLRDLVAIPAESGHEKPVIERIQREMEKYCPTWVLEENHPLVQAGVNSFAALYGRPPVVGNWTFSTNGVGSMGVMGVPTIGFGPGEEDVAHTVLERVPIRHLVEAAKFYAVFPLIYVSTVVGG